MSDPTLYDVWRELGEVKTLLEEHLKHTKSLEKQVQKNSYFRIRVMAIVGVVSFFTSGITAVILKHLLG